MYHINGMFCLLEVKSNTIILTVHTFCYSILTYSMLVQSKSDMIKLLYTSFLKKFHSQKERIENLNFLYLHIFYVVSSVGLFFWTPSMIYIFTQCTQLNKGLNRRINLKYLVRSTFGSSQHLGTGIICTLPTQLTYLAYFLPRDAAG